MIQPAVEASRQRTKDVGAIVRKVLAEQDSAGGGAKIHDLGLKIDHLTEAILKLTAATDRECIHIPIYLIIESLTKWPSKRGSSSREDVEQIVNEFTDHS